MAWRRAGDKPLSEPTMTYVTNRCIWITWPHCIVMNLMMPTLSSLAVPQVIITITSQNGDSVFQWNLVSNWSISQSKSFHSCNVSSFILPCLHPTQLRSILKPLFHPGQTPRQSAASWSLQTHTSNTPASLNTTATSLAANYHIKSSCQTMILVYICNDHGHQMAGVSQNLQILS